MANFRREGATRPTRAEDSFAPQARSRDAGRSPAAGPTNYWEQRVLADERKAAEIARNASAEMAKMYRQQYLRVVKEIERLKGDIDYGVELSRTQLWNYARWRKVEEALKGFVTEAVTIDTQAIHDALEKEFERAIGRSVKDYGGALGAGDSILLGTARKARILSGDWSGEHYSARVWKNTNAIADRMRNEITQMLVDGKSMQDIRRAVMKEFGVSYHNADRLVQTEVSYVHNRLALEEYRDLGLDQVQILTEANACEVCQEFPGQPYDINSAPFLPAHPRCRCCYAPWTYSDRKRWAEEHPERRVDQGSTRSAKADFGGSNRRFEAPNREGEKKEHLLEVVNVTPEGSDNLTFKIRPTERALQTLPRDGILGEPGTKVGGDGVQAICKIDRKIYSCITSDIPTDEVIITDERIDHSNLHKNAYNKYGKYIVQVLSDPDVIFEDDQVKTGIVIRKIEDEGVNLEVVLRIRLSTDPEQFKNSILSCWDIRERRLKQYRRNRKVLYSRPEL